jgi:hypothetical protein
MRNNVLDYALKAEVDSIPSSVQSVNTVSFICFSKLSAGPWSEIILLCPRSPNIHIYCGRNELKHCDLVSASNLPRQVTVLRHFETILRSSQQNRTFTEKYDCFICRCVCTMNLLNCWCENYHIFTDTVLKYLILYISQNASPNTVTVIKSRRMRWSVHVACMAEVRNVRNVSKSFRTESITK